MTAILLKNITLYEDIQDWYNSQNLAFTDATELLSLTETEVAAMEQISVIIGNNPRAIKRFVNIFQIVKAHGDLLMMDSEDELYIILFILALPLGKYRKLIPSFELYLFKHPDKIVKDYLESSNNEEQLQLKNKLNHLLSNKTEFHNIRTIQVSKFLKYITFIKRFTFDSTTTFD